MRKRQERIVAVFADLIPEHMEEGKIYVSRKYGVAAHLCCCGCRWQVVTPIDERGWELSASGSRPTLKPSIGNWKFACKSHYFITDGKVVWC